VKHDEIKDFMESMTMWFTVRDPKLLESLTPGDLISATLVLTAEDHYLTGIRKTGRRGPGKPPPAAGTGRLAAVGAPVPDITFTDEAGRPRPLSSYRGTYALLTFIYLRCPLPDYCPRMNAHFAAVQRGVLADAALRQHVRLLSISFDPDSTHPPGSVRRRRRWAPTRPSGIS